MARREPIIRASEIAQHAFCAHAWWLGRVQGYQSTNLRAMQRGSQQHQAHGRVVRNANRLRRLAVALLLVAVILLAAWFLVAGGG